MPPMQLLDSDNRKISTSAEWWDRRTNLERRLVLGASALLIFNLAFIITIAVLANQSPSTNEGCKSVNSAAEALAIKHNPAETTRRKTTTKKPTSTTTTTITTTTTTPSLETSSIPKCIPDESSIHSAIIPQTTTSHIFDTTTTRTTSTLYDITYQRQESNCATSACAAAACSISSSVNLKVDPCTNFYEYACGQWILENVLPNNTDSIMSRVAISHKAILAKDVLNQPVTEKEHIYKANVINFYKACMNLNAINNASVQPLRDFVSQYSVWAYGKSLWEPDKFIWTEAIAALDFDVFMWIDIKQDPLSETKNIIYLQPGSLGPFWTTQEYSSAIHQDNSEHALSYMKYMINIANALDPTITDLSTDTRNLALFEAKLANITLFPDGKNIREVPEYNRTTIRELSTKVPGINWLDYFRKVFPTDVDITENEEIMVNHIEFFNDLVSLIKETIKQTPKALPNYILVRIAMTYAFDLSSEFQNAYNDFTLDTVNINAHKLRWNYCLDLTVSEFPNSVGALYVEKYFPPEAFRVSQDIFNNITEEYKKVLVDTLWLDGQTRQDALNKVNGLKIRSIIGYLPKALDEIFLNEAHVGIIKMQPDTHFQNRVNLRHNDRDVYLKSVRAENVKNHILAKGGASSDSPTYSMEDNVLNVYAGSLKRPKFDEGYPLSFNYAGIGSEIAYLITLGLDENGREYDGKGNKIQWGLNSTYEIYDEKTKCFVEQYDQYTIEELGRNVNGTRTKDSNVAETTGLKIAFKAFMNAINNGAKELPLPGLQNFTSEQLFFLNFAQMYCGGSNIFSQVRTSILDQSPDKHRVNGVVSNFPEFATAFNCPVNSPMNPQKKCSVWG